MKHAGGRAVFVTSAADPAQLPPARACEVALVGRSNVGKSSLLTKLLGAPNLVRVSRTPGRTQLLNVFHLGERYAFIDLPGYGYAKLSLAVRAKLGRLLEAYLFGGRCIHGVLLLLDARRDDVSQLDRDMAADLLRANRPVLVVITKADLLPKTTRKAHLARLTRSLGVPPDWAVATSAKTGEGLSELWQCLSELKKSPDGDTAGHA